MPPLFQYIPARVFPNSAVWMCRHTPLPPTGANPCAHPIPLLQTRCASTPTGCTTLNLDWLGLTEVPTALRHMPCLRGLSLAGNPLHCLPSWFGSLRLAALNLSGSWSYSPGVGKQYARQLSEWLAQPSAHLPPTLHRLSLRDRPLSSIPGCVRGLRQLRALDLGDSLIFGSGRGYELQPVAFPPWFQELDAHLRCGLMGRPTPFPGKFWNVRTP